MDKITLGVLDLSQLKVVVELAEKVNKAAGDYAVDLIKNGKELALKLSPIGDTLHVADGGNTVLYTQYFTILLEEIHGDQTFERLMNLLALKELDNS